MNNDTENQSQTTTNDLKNRLINHLDDLREFAKLPETERSQITDRVCDFIADNFAVDAHKFFVGIEYLLRLYSIDETPALYTETIERDSPEAQKPQSHIEKYIAARFADSETERTGHEPQFVVAESAMFINFGDGTRLNDRSLLIVADSEKNGTIIEFPFNLGGQIAFRGSDALQKGRDRSAAGFEQFEKVIRKYFYFDKPAELAEVYDNKEFCFFAYGSTRDLTETLDHLTLSDDVIETPE